MARSVFKVVHGPSAWKKTDDFMILLEKYSRSILGIRYLQYLSIKLNDLCWFRCQICGHKVVSFCQALDFFEYDVCKG